MGRLNLNNLTRYNLLHKKFPVTSFTESPVLFDLLNKLLTYDHEKANKKNIKESRSIRRATLEGDVAWRIRDWWYFC
ncbi:hypothetical protein AAZX31_06G230000 [Glycine max]